MVAAEEQTFQNITVDTAYQMIKEENKYPNLIILDVRTPCEYENRHLYDAILMPYDEQLEAKISELEEYKNSEIIVYCKSGGRSQQTSEILIEYGFTKVYNMLGGIIAWVDADYPIYTTYHHVTVDKLEEELLFQIEPLIKSSYICCTKHQPNSNDIETPSITLTVLEEEENYTEILFTLEINDTIIEGTIAKTLIQSYEEFTDDINRTLNFVFTEIITQDLSMQFYTLSYLVQHVEYNLTLYTILLPLNSEIYNISFTSMSYESADKLGILTMDFVEFNFSVTLSQQYTILGKVAQEIGKIYDKSKDETLEQFVKAYYTMATEAKHLSKLVNKQLSEYNKPIHVVSATLRDDWVSCFWCTFVCELVLHIGLVAACAFYPPLCGICLLLMELEAWSAGLGCNTLCEIIGECP